MTRRITEYSLKKASEHVYYEAWMFFITAELLKVPRHQIEVNVLLDAFAIHTRNLFDFLYPLKPRGDDIIAADFLEKKSLYRQSKTKKQELAFIQRKANKQVAHLTYARNRYSKKNKPWPFFKVERGMKKSLIAFYDSLPIKYQRWQNFKELNQLLRP